VRRCGMKAQGRLVVEFTLARRRGREPGERPAAAHPGKLPRVTRLMALAIQFEGLIREGVVRDYAELARLGLVTRARVTQVMNLLLLAPDLQEEILYLPRSPRGRDGVSERRLRGLTAMVDWDRQRAAWQEVNQVKGPENQRVVAVERRL